MAKRTSKELRRWSRACFKWCDILWMGQFDKRTELDDEPYEDDGDGYSIGATTSTRVRYRMITMTANRDIVKQIDDKELDDLALHEVLHGVVAPLAEVCTEIIEGLPAGRRDIAMRWKQREVESVVTHLTDVIGATGIGKRYDRQHAKEKK